MRRLPIVCVVGSHENEWIDYAAPVGKMLAEQGFHLMTGAGGGVMQAVSKAFTSVEKRQGLCIGIIPTLNYEGKFIAGKEYPNRYIEVPVLTPLSDRAKQDTMPYSRNHVNIMSSQAIVALPGAHGTHNEVSLSLMYDKPVILYGPEEIFTKFPEAPLRADTIDHVSEFIDSKAVI
jgi:uncharacterized protein (TIGR00725 family)